MIEAMMLVPRRLQARRDAETLGGLSGANPPLSRTLPADVKVASPWRADLPAQIAAALLAELPGSRCDHSALRTTELERIATLDAEYGILRIFKAAFQTLHASTL